MGEVNPVPARCGTEQPVEAMGEPAYIYHLTGELRSGKPETGR